MCAACTGTHCRAVGNGPYGALDAARPYRNAPLAGSNFVVDFFPQILIHLLDQIYRIFLCAFGSERVEFLQVKPISIFSNNFVKKEISVFK
jgi:hypothetical protein